MTATAEWGSIQTAMERFELSRDTVRRMISRGEIEAMKIGPRLIRVNLTSIMAAGRSLAGVSADAFEDAS